MERVLDEVEAARLQSDDRYVESYIRSRAERGYGPVRILQELKARGVAAAGLRDRVESTDGAWAERAVEARRKKFGAAAPADYAERARQARFLEYRGYTPAQIRAALGAYED